MKTIAVLASVVLLSAWTAHGGSAQTIIRERAKELRDQNNVRQGVPPPSQPSQPPQQSQQPKPTAPTAQQQSLTKLQTDLAALKSGTAATDAQKQAIARDLINCAGTAKPSEAAANKFATDVSAALFTKGLSPTDRSRLVTDLNAILNPANFPQAKPDAIYADIQAIFQNSGVPRTAAVLVADDVKAIGAEIQKGGAK